LKKPGPGKIVRKVKVIRFWNSDVFENIDEVQEKIHKSLSNGLHPHL
jgi:very-short-patch-repair endonuclease